MIFLGNSDIVLTVSVLFFAAGLLSYAFPRRVHLAQGAVFIAGLLLYLVLHRYGSRMGTGSPALQLILLLLLTTPIFLNALSSAGLHETETNPNRSSILLFVFAGLQGIFWLVFFLSPWTTTLRGAPYPVYFAASAGMMIPIVFGSTILSRAATATTLIMLYAFLFIFGTGGLETRPEPLAVQLWTALLWSLPLPWFLFLSREAASLPARIAFGFMSLPCPVILLWPTIRTSGSPQMEFHAWWAAVLVLSAAAIALELHLKKAAASKA